METGQFRDLTRIYMLIVGAFSVVFFVRWVIMGYLMGGAAVALQCGAAFFVFLIIGAVILYIGLERYDTIFTPAPPVYPYYPAWSQYYPHQPYYPPAYGPYYPPGYYPPAGGYYPPPGYAARPPAYPYAPSYSYGYYPQAPRYPEAAPHPAQVATAMTTGPPPQPSQAPSPPSPAALPAPPAPASSAAPAVRSAPAAAPYPPPYQPAPAPLPLQPYALPPAVPSIDDIGNSRPLRLPSAPNLLLVFLGAIILGGFSLALMGATGYVSLVVFPLTFIIGFSFPSLIWISYVYSFERKAPRPSKSMLVAFTCGMLSTIPALIVNTAAAVMLGADSAHPTIVASLLTAAVVAPLIEEFSKPWGIFVVRDHVNSRLDGLIFGVTCGVGFALIENISYEVSFVLSGADVAAVWTLGSLARGLGSIMVHAAGAGLIGYAYGRYRVKKGSSLMVLPLAYIAAIIMHASWNGASVILSDVPYGDLLNIAFIPLFAVGAFLLLRYFLDRGAASELEPGGTLPEPQ